MDVDSTSISGRWWRQVPAGSDVRYEAPDSADNRWQRGIVVDALYFADSEPTTWAEWYRALAEAGVPPRRALPRDLWQWEISLPDVADISDDTRLTRVGLPALTPSRTQWPAFQLVGEALLDAGYPGLICASAARPAGSVLCVFRTAREVAGTQPIPPPATVDDPPIVPTGMRT